MNLPDESGLSVVVHSAPPGSSAEDGLKPLAGWTATTGREQYTEPAGERLPRQP